jgi:FAS-associated factor 2
MIGFERSYGRVHPSFYNGSCVDALRHAQAVSKLLLVYLHSEGHDHTDTFCRETLCVPVVVEFLDANFVVWAGNVSRPEGYVLWNRLNVEASPFLCVLVPSNGNQLVCLDRLQGSISAENLIDTLTRTSAAYENMQAAEVARRHEQM